VTTFREAFPILYVDDVAREMEFYVSNLGFEDVYRFPPEGEPDFVFLKLDPLGIALSKRPPDHAGRELELCIYAGDVDEAAVQLRAAGADELQAPADQEWGERLAYFSSPGGTKLHITAKTE
jgi:lactoylglutathione lyase